MDKRNLIERCQSGDRVAFGLFYRTYLTPMRDVVAHYVHDRDAVWDILHDGFLIAFASIGALKKADRVEAWLTSIMRNLALQYLKDKANRKYVPLSELTVAQEYEESGQICELTWADLDRLICTLPDGYGKVFRLAVLDGLSHKEIGALLGIAPHSSSSQLTHAKAMLRRMIAKYRAEMGILSIIGVLLMLWLGVFNRDVSRPTPVISGIEDDIPPVISDSISDRVLCPDSIVPGQMIIHNIIRHQKRGIVADVVNTSDSLAPGGNDSVAVDNVRIIPYVIGSGEFIANDDLPRIPVHHTPDWSMSLAYAGNLEQRELNRYMIPDPNLPDSEGPNGQIEVTERTHHYMPLVIGLSINKSITSRWSVETGLRYTYLRSDFLSESIVEMSLTEQHIHYMGVPLKFNYRIISYGGFTLYGHGGCALDIPVVGKQSRRQSSPGDIRPTDSTVRIHAPLQWSVEAGIGVQYHFTPSLSIYAEPSIRYYFNPGSDIRTIRQEKPFEISIPIGFRLTW